MNITPNKDRFPHLYELDKLGGVDSKMGVKYYNEHSDELQNEYSKIMHDVVVRNKFGDNKNIHGTNKKEKEE